MEKFGVRGFFLAGFAGLVQPVAHETRHRFGAVSGDDDHVRIDRFGHGGFPQARMAQAGVFAKIRFDDDVITAIFRQPALQFIGAVHGGPVFAEEKYSKRGIHCLFDSITR